MVNKECIITFPNITNAMKLEKKMKELNMSFKIIPVPRSISSSCGICIKFNCEKRTEIEKLYNDNHIKFDGIYDIIYPNVAP
ncbi:MAG TPA: phytoene dehydrogenase [Clostridiales bacterium]|jgi:hypothetical protein|nr:phytoene dehydrogenase [Clostridiales bacterium]